jgi:hypothetical protein
VCAEETCWLQLRRLRYFSRLLAAGYRQALDPDPFPDTLRLERLALGIDVPELDTVPAWSVRREDGAVSVPFIEYLLAQVCGCLEALCPPGSEERGHPDFARGRRLLEPIRSTVSPGDSPPAAGLPRLGEVFVPPAVLERLCGWHGLLDLILRRCESAIHHPVAAEAPLA